MILQAFGAELLISSSSDSIDSCCDLFISQGAVRASHGDSEADILMCLVIRRLVHAECFEATFRVVWGICAQCFADTAAELAKHSLRIDFQGQVLADRREFGKRSITAVFAAKCLHQLAQA